MWHTRPIRVLLAVALAVAGFARAASAQHPVVANRGMTLPAASGEYGELPPHFSASEGGLDGCGPSGGGCGPSGDGPCVGMARGYLPGQGSGGCGCDGGCDCGPVYGPYGGGACCCPHHAWGFGVGGSFLSARWKTNPAFLTFDTNGAVDVVTQTDFDYNTHFAPLVWLGWQADCGLGIKGRAWWFDDDDQLSFVNAAGVTVASAAPLGLQLFSATAGSVWTFDSSLEIQVQDLMLTYAAPVSCGWVEFGVGARHARIEQEYHARVVTAGVTSAVDSSSSFEGAGLSFAVEGRLSLTQRLSLISALRYSLLIGSAEQEASLTAPQLQNGNANVTARQANDDFRPVTELEFGADYSLCCCCWEWYVQAAFVAQLWQGAGNSANNDLLFDENAVRGLGAQPDKNADLMLYGLRLETGLRF